MNEPWDSARTGAVVWITGRPSSGKSVLAEQLKRALDGERPTCILDGDHVRAALTPTPGYTPAARADFYATLIGLARLLADQGLVVLVPATAASREIRERARQTSRFLEIYVDTPLAECERRDTKGLYRSAREGKLQDVPGVDVPYEVPTEPEVTAHGGHDQEAIREVIRRLQQLSI